MLRMVSVDGYFRQLNSAWEKIVGWSIDELIERPYLEFVHPEDREATAIEARRLSMGENVISIKNGPKEPHQANKAGGGCYL